jgi:ribosome biogenesis GTPase
MNLCLIAAEDQGLKSLILLNKADMIEPTRNASKILEPYKQLGYSVLALCAKQDISSLLPFLEGQTSVLVGQSGMGKSTLINTLIPESCRATGEISSALDAGRHTTTHARLFHLSDRSHIVDSPGLQEFGLHHLDLERIAHAFVEFRPYLGHCKFRNCWHLDEPGCAIAAAFEAGLISEQRMRIYRKLATRLHFPKFRKGLNDR